MDDDENARPVRTKEQIDELTATLTEAYERGLSLKQLERHYDVSSSYAGRLLRAAGVELRPASQASLYRRTGGLTREQQWEYQRRLAERGNGRR